MDNKNKNKDKDNKKKPDYLMIATIVFVSVNALFIIFRDLIVLFK